MKNITISIDEETHLAARLHAASLGTSISALVKDYLAGLVASVPSPESRVREMRSGFTLAAVSPVLAAQAAPPWIVNGKPVWTKDGKPRQPGALRTSGASAEDDALAALPADMLASFDVWDEGSFDPLP